MKILYKPFSAIATTIAARLGSSTFKALWSRIDEAEPPKPTTAQTTLPKVIGAAVLEAAIMAAAGAAADRGGAMVFQHLTGAWPGAQTQGAD